jgi:hypothetical protein
VSFLVSEASLSGNEDEMAENNSHGDVRGMHVPITREFVGIYQAKCSAFSGHVKNASLHLI